MEINNLFGLPVHPLLVHIPVVLIPLATAIGSLLVAVRGSWRRTFAIPVAVVALAGAGGVFLAAKSGGSLEERVKETDLVHDHAAAGERADRGPRCTASSRSARRRDRLDRSSATGHGRPGRAAAAGDGGTGGGTAGDATGRGTATATATTTSTAASWSGRTLLTRAVPVVAVVTLLSGCVASVRRLRGGPLGSEGDLEQDGGVQRRGGRGPRGRRGRRLDGGSAPVPAGTREHLSHLRGPVRRGGVRKALFTLVPVLLVVASCQRA